MAKLIVLADDDQGGKLAIGPVYSEESADRLRQSIDDCGWTVRRTVPLLSVAAFAGLRRSGSPATGGES
ncbi:MAG: hypothetical protein ACYCO9_06380 [Streptosporangiaceae bacterium]